MHAHILLGRPRLFSFSPAQHILQPAAAAACAHDVEAEKRLVGASAPEITARTGHVLHCCTPAAAGGAIKTALSAAMTSSPAPLHALRALREQPAPAQLPLSAGAHALSFHFRL